jgi:hypothetical protein
MLSFDSRTHSGSVPTPLAAAATSRVAPICFVRFVHPGQPGLVPNPLWLTCAQGQQADRAPPHPELQHRHLPLVPALDLNPG